MLRGYGGRGRRGEHRHRLQGRLGRRQLLPHLVADGERSVGRGRRARGGGAHAVAYLMEKATVNVEMVNLMYRVTHQNG